MPRSTCDLMWREAMMDLLDQLEAENPEDPALAPHVRLPCA
jgi:IQ and AAA domain-containing protein